jgi:hypothetical protein
MKLNKGAFPLMACSFALYFSNGLAEEVLVRSPNGTPSVVEIDFQDSFASIIEQLEVHFANELAAAHPEVLQEDFQSEVILDFTSKNHLENRLVAFALPRDFTQQVTPSQKSDISFIITTLGMSSLVKIGKSKSSLTKAGNRVDRIHPLRFLQCIFTDEKMKAGIYNMQSRGWIWGEFMDGIKKSCKTEFGLNNLRPDQVQEFAANLGIDPSLIQGVIAQQNWTKLVSVLIEKIPRKENQKEW